MQLCACQGRRCVCARQGRRSRRTREAGVLLSKVRGDGRRAEGREVMPTEPRVRAVRTEFAQRRTRAVTAGWSSQHGRTRHSRIARRARIARCARTSRSALDTRRLPEARCTPETRCALESRCARGSQCARNSRGPRHSHDTWKARMPLSSSHHTKRVNVVHTLLGGRVLSYPHVLEPRCQVTHGLLRAKAGSEKCRRYVSKYMACSCHGYRRCVAGYRLCARESARASDEAPLGF